LEDALGRYQVTHIHSSIREALKAMEVTESTLPVSPEGSEATPKDWFTQSLVGGWATPERGEPSPDSQPTEPLKHKWVGRMVGGSPANAESCEWVRYCDVCGMEDTCEDDPIPPCEGFPSPEPDQPTCGKCGRVMEQKFFKGGFPPIWRCRACEYGVAPKVAGIWSRHAEN